MNLSAIRSLIDSDITRRTDAEHARIMAAGKELVRLLVDLDPHWTVTEGVIYEHIRERVSEQVAFENEQRYGGEHEL